MEGLVVQAHSANDSPEPHPCTTTFNSCATGLKGVVRGRCTSARLSRRLATWLPLLRLFIQAVNLDKTGGSQGCREALVARHEPTLGPSKNLSMHHATSVSGNIDSS